MLIGELSKRSGLSRDTLRYYEKLELIAAEGRHAANEYKNYGRAALERLGQVQRLKEIGFTLREVGRLLAIGAAAHPCKDLPGQLAQKLGVIDQQVAELLTFKASLLAMKSACDGACGSRDGVPTCVPPAGPVGLASKCC